MSFWSADWPPYCVKKPPLSESSVRAGVLERVERVVVAAVEGIWSMIRVSKAVRVITKLEHSIIPVMVIAWHILVEARCGAFAWSSSRQQVLYSTAWQLPLMMQLVEYDVA